MLWTTTTSKPELKESLHPEKLKLLLLKMNFGGEAECDQNPATFSKLEKAKH